MIRAAGRKLAASSSDPFPPTVVPAPRASIKYGLPTDKGGSSTHLPHRRFTTAGGTRKTELGTVPRPGLHEKKLGFALRDAGPSLPPLGPLPGTRQQTTRYPAFLPLATSIP